MFGSVALKGKLEMELAQLPAEDAAMFMEEYGIKELSLSKMISLSVRTAPIAILLHRWRRRSARLDAATIGALPTRPPGQIHTDLQKGFIRAEVMVHELIDFGRHELKPRQKANCAWKVRNISSRTAKSYIFEFNI